jgi:triosephosphate isomerase (TIM)
MSHLIFAANWKMNLGPQAAVSFLRSFLPHYRRQYDRTMIFFPSAVALAAVAEEVHDRPDIEVGVQNIHWEDQGAFTGELSGSMAREAGASYALVGHSERRHVFGESDEETALKCAAAHRGGLTPLLCVGETLGERKAGEAEQVVARQLRTGLSKLPANATVVVAYEPVWAIGTGQNATPADAGQMHAHIRANLRQLTGERGAGVQVLYGGSVNAGNVVELLAAPYVDGVLVGGASLQPSTWSAIARAQVEAPESTPDLPQGD